MQYLFLSGTEASPRDKIEVENLKPNTNYDCTSEVFYENYRISEKNQTIQTKPESEYSTYIYT